MLRTRSAGLTRGRGGARCAARARCRRAGTGATSPSPGSGASSRSALIARRAGGSRASPLGRGDRRARARYDVPDLAEASARWAFASSSPRRSRRRRWRSLYERELELPAVGRWRATSAALAVGAGLELAGHDLRVAARARASAAVYVALGVAFLRRGATRARCSGLLGARARPSRRRSSCSNGIVARARAGRRPPRRSTLLARFEERLDVGRALAARARARPRRSSTEAHAERPLRRAAPSRRGRARRCSLVVARRGVYAQLAHPAARGRRSGRLRCARRCYAASLAILELAETLGGARRHGVPARPHGGQRRLGPRRARRSSTPASKRGSTRAPARRLRPLRDQPREALRLRPRVPQLGRARALVPRGRRVLILRGGFFYQRLGAEADVRTAARTVDSA